MKLIRNLILFGIILFVLLTPIMVEAGILDSLTGIQSLQSSGQIVSFINSITRIILGIVGLLATLFLIIGGYQYISSTGDPQKKQKATMTITYSIIGLVITLLAGSITGFFRPVIDRIRGPIASGQINVVIVEIIKTTLIFFGGLSILFLIVGGYLYISSAGNPEMIEKAKKTITNAITGIVIVILSRAITGLVENKVRGNPPLKGIFNTFINTALSFIGTAALLSLIVGGYLYMTSAGDPEKISKAKNAIKYSIIGLVTALFSYIIFRFIANALGVQ